MTAECQKDAVPAPGQRSGSWACLDISLISIKLGWTPVCWQAAEGRHSHRKPDASSQSANMLLPSAQAPWSGELSLHRNQVANSGFYI